MNRLGGGTGFAYKCNLDFIREGYDGGILHGSGPRDLLIALTDLPLTDRSTIENYSGTEENQ